MSNTFSFVGGSSGQWRVLKIISVRGAGLDHVERIDIVNSDLSAVPLGSKWLLRGFTSNLRYITKREKDQLAAVQPPLDRREAMLAALIATKKNAAWWGLAQGERRRVCEEVSCHMAAGLQDFLALDGPFDALTWFEYAPQHAAAFERLVAQLRLSAKWHYVEREVDIRLIRV